MKRFFGIALALVMTIGVFAQNGYKIKIRLDGFKQNMLLLTSYYGNKIKLVDTAYAKKPGTFVFEGGKTLMGGIYMVVSPKKKKLFEFIVNKKQDFSLNTDTSNYLLNMKIVGSPENVLFFHYLKKNEKLYSQIGNLSQQLKKSDKGSPSYKALKQKIDSLNKVSDDHKLTLIKKNPHTFFATLLRAMREVKVPANPNPSDSLFAYRFARNHFWDFFDLNDPRLLRTPLYDRKINAYFKYFVPLNPDSVDRAIDFVISKSQSCSECVSYLVWKFTIEYQNPKYMGFDKVFVHMVDNYFSKEHIENVTPSILKILKERADALRPLLLGQPAPDLILMDTGGQYIGFRSLKSRFTLLFFWDYHCGICKKEIAALIPFYKKDAKKYNLEVYGISINPDLDNWKKAVRERRLPWVNVNGTRSVKGNYAKSYNIHGTPQLFLLNKEGKIIAKHFSVNQLKMILDSYLKAGPFNSK